MGAPELSAVLHMGPHENRVEERHNDLFCPSDHILFEAAKDSFGSMDCKHKLLALFEFLINQQREVLLFRAVLSLFSA